MQNFDFRESWRVNYGIGYFGLLDKHDIYQHTNKCNFLCFDQDFWSRIVNLNKIKTFKSAKFFDDVACIQRDQRLKIYLRENIPVELNIKCLIKLLKKLYNILYLTWILVIIQTYPKIIKIES